MTLTQIEKHYAAAMKKWQAPTQRVLSEPAISPVRQSSQLLPPPMSVLSFGATPPNYAVPSATVKPQQL